MSTIITSDDRYEAKRNFWLQIILLVPALVIFGFTILNIVTAIGFLVLATFRLVYPTEAMRKFELYTGLIITAAWLLTVIF